MSEIFTDWLAKPYVLLIKTCHPERSDTCAARSAGEGLRRYAAGLCLTFEFKASKQFPYSIGLLRPLGSRNEMSSLYLSAMQLISFLLYSE